MTQPPPSLPGMHPTREPRLWEALTPVAAIIVFLGVGAGVLGIRTELLLIAAAVVTGLVARRLGLSWRGMQDGVIHSIGKAMPAILIVIVVGALIASWTMAGTIPMIVEYGLHLISPKWFLPTACIVCSIVSVVIGTSWGTIGTVGLALIGIAEGLGLPLGPAAGAVVAGAYFGDKLSPFSDTTNLAPIAARANLYDHIQHMLWTTTPAWLLGLAVYLLVGLGHDGADSVAPQVAELSAALRTHFNLHWLLWLPPAITLVAAVLKKPVIPGMLLSIAVALVLAFTVQSLDERVLGPRGTYEQDHLTAVRITKTLVTGPAPSTGFEALDRIAGRGGMLAMMDTALLAICAFAFAGIAQRAGMLDVLLRGLSRLARTTGQLIGSTVAACLLVAGITGNSYLAILVPGELFADAYKRRGLAAKNLSRTTEDAGTVLVPIIPWSISAVFIHSTLGVPATQYAPWAVMCYGGLVMALIYGFTGFAIAPRRNEDETQPGS